MQIELTRQENKVFDETCLYQDWEDIPVYKVTLESAITLALEHNLDLRVKAQEIDLEEEVLTHARLDVLPRLVQSNYNSWRNKSTAATAQNLDPVTLKPVGPLSPPAISSTRTTSNNDLTLSWSLLDFGLSYYRARNEANNTIIKYLEYERTKQNIIYDVVRLYWQVAALQKGLNDAKEWLENSNRVINLVQDYVDKGLMSPIQAAYYNNQLLDSKIRIEVFGPVFLRVYNDFKTLLGLPPVYEIEFIDVNFQREKIELPSLLDLEQLALLNRPELYSTDLQELNVANDLRQAIIQAFPDITPFFGRFHDSNPFLSFHNWYQVGIHAAWNLLAIPQNLQLMRVDQARKDLVKDQRLVLSLGILAQVHLAHSLYEQGFVYFRSQQIYLRNAETVRKTSERMRELHAKGDLELLVAQGFAYRAQIEALNLYAEFASALELLNNSLGLPRYLEEHPKKMGVDETPKLPVMLTPDSL